MDMEIELEMENMVRSKTQKLWNITLQVKILHKVLKKHFPYKPNSDSKEFNTIKVWEGFKKTKKFPILSNIMYLLSTNV